MHADDSGWIVARATALAGLSLGGVKVRNRSIKSVYRFRLAVTQARVDPVKAIVFMFHKISEAELKASTIST